tara:strand:+ start:333 stop:668 length:336 start_codon:yes stop_codon:yes gene_type:complete
MEFWNEKEQRAAKPHRCVACCKTIEVGDRYSYMAGKWDGVFYVVKQHRECRAAEIALAALHGLADGEEWICLNDMDEIDDIRFVREGHPVAFARIAERYEHWFEDEDDAQD